MVITMPEVGVGVSQGGIPVCFKQDYFYWQRNRIQNQWYVVFLMGITTPNSCPTPLSTVSDKNSQNNQNRQGELMTK